MNNNKGPFFAIKGCPFFVVNIFYCLAMSLCCITYLKIRLCWSMIGHIPAHKGSSIRLMRITLAEIIDSPLPSTKYLTI